MALFSHDIGSGHRSQSGQLRDSFGTIKKAALSDGLVDNYYKVTVKYSQAGKLLHGEPRPNLNTQEGVIVMSDYELIMIVLTIIALICIRDKQ